MTEDPALTVILLTRNGARTIGRQLEALANQSSSEPWELVVVDNGSSDRTLEIVEEYRSRLPSLRVADASGDRGAAHACNIGARSGQAGSRP